MTIPTLRMCSEKQSIPMQIAEKSARSPSARSNAESSDTNYAEYVSRGDGFESVATDGRISVLFDFKDEIPELAEDHAQDTEEFAIDKEWLQCPNMNIVIMIVGSRGDVQPYVALGQSLSKDGHRVRIATHETFRAFVTEADLEFFNIGGNPQDLMSYMVKNPGLMPGLESLANGDIVKKRKMLNEMIDGCWHSCHSPCPITGRSFVADVIISNPPTFAHIHCAEALGIPLLLSFTMPWSPTTAFAHPLVNITTSNANFGVTNYLSYAAAELLTWNGVGDIINTFRTSKLGLSPLSIRTGPGYVDRLKIPWTYCMSPALVPKPHDWKNHIDVTGFYFLDLSTNYQPPPELASFLSDGEAPVYIGFGSVVIDDPAAMSEILFDATKQAGVRALVSSGWGGLGGASVPPHVFILGNVPHDWLFDKGRVSAVVHHGGAGTTAIGLAKGCPTVVVPFFGDQAFWGNMIYRAGAGPKPIHHKELTAQKLKDAIVFATSSTAKEAVGQLARSIREESGVLKGKESIYKHLPLLNMRCDLDPSRVAVWWSREQCLKLSAFAVQTLADAKLLSLRTLILHRPKDYKLREKATDPLGGFGGVDALLWSLTSQTRLGGIVQSAATKADSSYATANGILDAMTSISEGLRDSSPQQPEREDVTSSPLSNKGPNGSPAPKSIISALKRIVKGHKKEPSISRLTIPVQGAWKVTALASGKILYNRQRLTRIAEGRRAVENSTGSQRAMILQRYGEEVSETPKRQILYRDAIGKATSSSDETDSDRAEKSKDTGVTTTSVRFNSPATKGTSDADERTASGLTLLEPPSSDLNSGEDTEHFVREMELAMKLSLEEYGRSRGGLDSSDDSFDD